MQLLRRIVPAVVLSLIFLACSWALFSPHFFRVHDFTHAGRIAEMARALSDGQFPVRWSQNFGYGYGMPLFEFYGPLPFYVGGLLFLLGVPVIVVIKILYLIANTVTVLGGYAVGRKFFGTNGGLIASAALTLAPYRALNLFVRGALNETWAIAFLPWIVLGVVKIFQRERRGWLTLTVSLAGLLLSHNIMTLLFLPLLAGFIGLYFVSLVVRRVPELYRKGEFRWRNFLRMAGQLVGGGMLAVGLSAFYVGPAFLEKNLTQVERIILGSYFDYHLHFLYIRQLFTPGWGYGGSGWGVTDDISFFLGWGQWVAAGVLLVLVLRGVWRRLRHTTPVFPSRRVGAIQLTSMALLLVSLYLSLLKSEWVWEAVPVLRYAQFPWRALGVAIVFWAIAVAGMSSFIRGKVHRSLLTCILVGVTILGSVGLFRPETYLENDTEFYYTDPLRIRRQLSDILPDYVAAGMTVPPSTIPEGLLINAPELPADQYEILTDRSHEKLILTTFKEETVLSFAVADYDGWRTEIDNQRWNRQIGVDGNIELAVPAGSHFVTLRFLDTPVRLYADLLSLIAWLVLIGILLPVKRKTP